MNEEQFKASVSGLIERNFGGGKKLTRKDASFLSELAKDLDEANWSKADVFMLKDIAERYGEE